MHTFKIVFERLTNPDVISYEVLSSPPNTRLQDRVFVIDNPKEINPVKVSVNLSKKDNINTDKYTQMFALQHHSIMIDDKLFLSARLNGKPFDRELIHINKNAKVLFVYYELLDDDVLTVDYYIDAVEFEFQTPYEDYIYTVKPIVDGQSSLIGKHNILV